MLTVVLNGSTVLEYEVHQRLPGQVRKLLEEMDADMTSDVVVGGERIENPAILQRARFVGMKLIQAIEVDNRVLQAAACAWLGSRVPALKQLTAEDNGAEVTMQLIME